MVFGERRRRLSTPKVPALRVWGNASAPPAAAAAPPPPRHVDNQCPLAAARGHHRQRIIFPPPARAPHHKSHHAHAHSGGRVASHRPTRQSNPMWHNCALQLLQPARTDDTERRPPEAGRRSPFCSTITTAVITTEASISTCYQLFLLLLPLLFHANQSLAGRKPSSSLATVASTLVPLSLLSPPSPSSILAEASPWQDPPSRTARLRALLAFNNLPPSLVPCNHHSRSAPAALPRARPTTPSIALPDPAPQHTPASSTNTKSQFPSHQPTSTLARLQTQASSRQPPLPTRLLLLRSHRPSVRAFSPPFTGLCCHCALSRRLLARNLLPSAATVQSAPTFGCYSPSTGTWDPQQTVHRQGDCA
ncbi:hypothetical protein CDD80_6729 [Ophiocordyceps camponoti-rufipedis]|uniref:Uncharacterized protein n=1 Tax=Ophiocordyceps camponoti-rufipedis TaxID=2004952 RepID=A0A2C5YRC0_9HYPO|nr:hypothetical protein CDD80_6729 [Ophiocordyceps camponoti-rufipedis]